jgi:hypothetical protein
MKMSSKSMNQRDGSIKNSHRRSRGAYHGVVFGQDLACHLLLTLEKILIAGADSCRIFDVKFHV